LNLLSGTKTLTWTAGQKIRVTLASSARQTGEDIFSYVLSGENSGNPQSAIQLAKWQAKDADQVTLRTLSTFELTRDSHLSLSFAIATSDDFPDNPVNGQVRQISSSGLFYEYDAEAIDGEYPASAGYWVWLTTETNSTYIADTEDGGSDQEVISLTSNEILLPPIYAGNGGDSTPVKYWLLNGFTESGSEFPVGSAVNLQVQINDDPALGVALSGKLIARVLGIVRRSTGVLTNALAEYGQSYVWESGSSLFSLSVPIPSGYALAMELYYNFQSIQLRSAVGVESFFVQVLPYLAGKFGELESSWFFFGNSIPDSGDKMRIVPALTGISRASGTCLIERYIASVSVPENFAYGLVSDAANQKVCLSAALGGQVTIRAAASALQDSEAVRAKISTLPGEKLSDWSADLTLSANQGLSISIPHPCDSDGNAVIRSDYPDPAIAGSDALYNLASLRIYIQIGGTTYRSAVISVILGSTQVVTVTSFTGFSTVSLPTNPDDWFDLWENSPPTLSATTGTLAAGTYRVKVAHLYASPNYRITSITHRTIDGCIPEISQTLAEVTNTLSYWREAVSTKSDLKALSTTGLSDGRSIRLVLQNNALYRFALSLPSADDGETYLAADDVSARGWIKISASGSGGGHTINALAAQPNLTFSNQFAVSNNAENASTDVGLAQNAIALDRIAIITGNRLLGKIGTNGTIVQIPLGAGLEFTGGALVCTATGAAATIDLGIVTTGDAGSSASVTNRGTTSAAVFDFTIPRGTDGTNGTNGINAFTSTNASFIVPAVSSSVTITVLFAASLVEGMIVLIEDAGYYSVAAVISSTSISVTNLGYAGNASPTTDISTNKKVIPSGVKGADGAGNIAVTDESTVLTLSATSFMFTGSGVTATNTGGNVIINIPGSSTIDYETIRFYL
jgi:hypothetical protein